MGQPASSNFGNMTGIKQMPATLIWGRGMSGMNGLERRHLDRITPERLVYVDLKPDNGGIVLNVSDEGLCFQSIAPVKKHQSLSFSFLEHNLPAEAVGEVVWTDETQKFAGLRFTRVSAETRNEIEEVLRCTPWNCDNDPSSTPQLSFEPDDNQETAALVPVEVEQASPLQIALLREANYFPSRDFDEIVAVPSSSKTAVTPPLQLTDRRGRVWLSRILVAALVIYAVGASIALYRLHRLQRSGPEGRTAVQSTPPVQAAATSPEVVRSPVVTTTLASKDHALSEPRAVPAPAIAAERRNKTRAVEHSAAAITQPILKERAVIKSAPIRFEYPIVAAGAPSGTVNMRILIGTTGSIEQVRILGGNRTLAKASSQAVRRWRYRPLEMDGHPVEAEAHVRIRFAGDEAISIKFQD